MQRRGNSQKYLESLLIPQVVAEPTGIWEGFQREGTDSAVCYAGRPRERKLRDAGITVPCPKGMVFSVYTAEKLLRNGQREVIKWGWVREHESDKGFPFDHESKFGKRLWP